MSICLNYISNKLLYSKLVKRVQYVQTKGRVQDVNPPVTRVMVAYTSRGTWYVLRDKNKVDVYVKSNVKKKKLRW